MNLLGKGRLKYLSPKLKHSQAKRLSNQLKKACGCELVYHKKRNCYVVCRQRGTHRAPRTYTDLRISQLRSSMIPFIKDVVRWADYKANGDFQKMMDIQEKYFQEENQKVWNSHLDDIMPEFYSDMKRVREHMQRGRYKSRFMDLGSIKTPTGGPTGLICPP